MESGYEKTFMFAQSNTFIQLDGSGIKPFQLRWVILTLRERIISKRENEISICQEKTMNRRLQVVVFFPSNIEKSLLKQGSKIWNQKKKRENIKFNEE